MPRTKTKIPLLSSGRRSQVARKGRVQCAGCAPQNSGLRPERARDRPAGPGPAAAGRGPVRMCRMEADHDGGRVWSTATRSLVPIRHRSVRLLPCDTRGLAPDRLRPVPVQPGSRGSESTTSRRARCAAGPVNCTASYGERGRPARLVWCSDGSVAGVHDGWRTDSRGRDGSGRAARAPRTTMHRPLRCAGALVKCRP